MKAPRLSELKEVLCEAAALVADCYERRVAVERKADGSPVTEADTRADLLLRVALPKVRPAAWLSEETADDRRRLQEEWVWVVDPLDGTKEFVRRIPEFAISIGLVHRGEAVAGGIVNPISGEGGVATIGQAPEFWGGLKPRPPAAHLASAHACLSRSELEDQSVRPWVNLVGGFSPVGSIAYKLLRVAAGVEHVTYSVKPKSEWDVCGGVALLKASGRVYRRFDGVPVGFNQEDVLIKTGAAAGPQELVEALIERINAGEPSR